ncbi:MAG TPA: helix-turn-helix transcriptional regulator [Verrucomicrobiae bacterium]|jgi:AraC-like DNA-binding protein
MRLRVADAWGPGGEGLSFILVKGGKGRYATGKSTWNLSSGDVLVLNPAAGGKLFGQSGDVLFWEFSVRFEHLFSLFSGGEIPLLQYITESFKHSKLYAASSALAKECHSLAENAPAQGNIDHRSQMLRVAAAVLSMEFVAARERRTGFVQGGGHMLRIFESLSANDLLTLSVGNLAIKFSCGRRHLNRLFNQHFGCSVAALRMEMRLLKAASLLRDRETKVITVAEQCGFNHLGLFNICFKRRFGDTPGQWRKSGLTATLAPQATGQSDSAIESSLTKRSSDGTTATAVQTKAYKILSSAYANLAGNESVSGMPPQKRSVKGANSGHRQSL